MECSIRENEIRRFVVAVWVLIFMVGCTVKKEFTVNTFCERWGWIRVRSSGFWQKFVRWILVIGNSLGCRSWRRPELY